MRITPRFSVCFNTIWRLAGLLVVSSATTLCVLGCSQQVKSSRAAEAGSIDRDSTPKISATVSAQGPTVARYAGQPTAIFFWSSWCKVCVEELPKIQRLADELESSSGNTVQVRAVAALDGVDTAERAMASRGFYVPVTLDPEARIARDLGVNGLPAMVLLNAQGERIPMLDLKDGQYRTVINGPRNWDDPKVIQFLRGVRTEPVLVFPSA